MIGNNIKNNHGFSLLEMLVSVGIFVVITMLVLEIFQNSILVQKQAIVTQEVQEGIRYALEVMSKELRSARNNVEDPTVEIPTNWNECPYPTGTAPSNPGNLDGKHKVYNFDVDDSVLYFRNKDDKCVYYFLDNKRIFIDRDGVELPITPSNVEVKNFSAVIEDDLVGSSPLNQANVTISIELDGETEDFSNIRLQTSITARNYQ